MQAFGVRVIKDGAGTEDEAAILSDTLNRLLNVGFNLLRCPGPHHRAGYVAGSVGE